MDESCWDLLNFEHCQPRVGLRKIVGKVTTDKGLTISKPKVHVFLSSKNYVVIYSDITGYILDNLYSDNGPA